MTISSQPHRRLNPLTGEWLLVSPHRTQRPWQGKVESVATASLPQHDPACYLCPGNTRAGGEKNPAYDSTYVFVNDYASLLPDTQASESAINGLLVSSAERGICRVLCFSPRHDLTLARMDTGSIERVVDAWMQQYAEVGAIDYINHVQIFENRGDTMGCSNPHPHGQIWANQTVPLLVEREGFYQEDYRRKKNCCMLCDYVTLELDRKERVVLENDTFAVVVPFWAVWPFETLLLPKMHISDIGKLEPAHKADLADAMRRLGIRYDNLFSTSFPYSMGIHQRPTDGKSHPHWHFHMHYYPPLLRSATVKKFMVGYEMLAQPQRDITPELAAERLRGCSERHYADPA